MPFPVNLKPKHSYKLIRLGSDRDGGYLVDEKSLTKSGCLIAMGISTDWSFEKDFKRRKSVPIHCYDYSLTVGFSIMYAIKSFLQLFQGKISPFLLAIKTVIKYFFFWHNWLDFLVCQKMIKYILNQKIICHIQDSFLFKILILFGNIITKRFSKFYIEYSVNNFKLD